MKSPWSSLEAQGNLVTSTAGLMASGRLELSLDTTSQLDYFYGLVKRQLLRCVAQKHVTRHGDTYLTRNMKVPEPDLTPLPGQVE